MDGRNAWFLISVQVGERCPTSQQFGLEGVCQLGRTPTVFEQAIPNYIDVDTLVVELGRIMFLLPESQSRKSIMLYACGRHPEICSSDPYRSRRR